MAGAAGAAATIAGSAAQAAAAVAAAEAGAAATSKSGINPNKTICFIWGYLGIFGHIRGYSGKFC